jgi:hypothetical protein
MDLKYGLICAALVLLIVVLLLILFGNIQINTADALAALGR